MDACLQLYCRRVAAAKDRHEEPESGLEAACRPARLLPPVRVDRYRQLLRHDQVFDVGRFPTTQLRAIAEIQVLSQRSGAPTAGVLHGGSSPYAGSAGEVGEVTAG